MVKVKDLPIYGDPEPAEFEFVPEKESAFRHGVSDIRRTTFEAAFTFEDNWKQLVKFGEGLRAYSKDTLKFIQEDSSVLQRAGVITIAGLGGVVAGYRGGVLRKATLASAGMLTAASVCYPNQAVDISRRGWDAAKQQGREMWQQVPREKPKDIVKNKVETVEQEVKDKLTTAPTDNVTVDPSKLDFGQAKAEDKDMYSTRTS